MNFFVVWLQRDCNYRDEIQKRIALHEFQSSEALGDFWSFLKFSEALHVYPNRFYVCNQVSQKAKGEISNWDAIANPKRAIQVQAMFSAKKKPWLETPMTRNSTAIMPMDIRKQAIKKKNCPQVEFERQAVRKKATRSALRLCLHTVDRTFIYTNFLLLWIWQI